MCEAVCSSHNCTQKLKSKKIWQKDWIRKDSRRIVNGLQRLAKGEQNDKILLTSFCFPFAMEVRKDSLKGKPNKTVWKINISSTKWNDFELKVMSAKTIVFQGFCIILCKFHRM